MILPVIVGLGVAALFCIVGGLFVYLNDRARCAGYVDGMNDAQTMLERHVARARSEERSVGGRVVSVMNRGPWN